MRVELDEAVQAEFHDATQWYLEKLGPVAARRFVAEVRRVMAGVTESPRRWPEYEPGIRRALLLNFPYSLFYEIDEDHIRIFAIAHQRREPGYWHGRR
jgi:toxin ParE1/3/4